MKRPSRLLWFALALLGGVSGARAEDIRYSAFGTVGYARTDSEFRYQRFIDSNGTLFRDSRFGVQAEANLAPGWSATVQARLAPADDSDKEWKLKLPWAFVSWRPDNEWTIRAGKLRIPLQLYSDSLDVGTTFPFARLPVETYTVSPTYDFYALAVGKSWLGSVVETELEGYAGWMSSWLRVYMRDAKGFAAPGVWHEGMNGPVLGGVLTVREGDNRYRLGVMAWQVKPDFMSFPTTYPFVTVAPGLGYYQVDDKLPGPGVAAHERAVFYGITAGIEHTLPAGFRTVSEVTWRSGQRVNVGAGLHSVGAYAALLRPVGAWTPYVYGATLRSSERARRQYAELNASSLPAGVPGADVLNASQTWAADTSVVTDQRTWAVGTSYALARGQLLKAEWQRTHTGLASLFVDAPLGTRSGGQQLDVFSLSYNFSF